LTPRERDENRRAVHDGWRRHAADVRHSHAGGFYQGWDLHPAQLPTRYAGVYAFFLEGLDAAAVRLRSVFDRAAATHISDIRDDDSATGQGLLNHFRRAMDCGAITEDTAVAMTGLTVLDLHRTSFEEIVRNRTPSAAQ
jgi:hypothetical protein